MRTIVSISDLHIDHQRDDLLEIIVQEHGGSKAVLAISGDLLDAEEVTNQHVDRASTLWHQYHVALRWLESVDGRFSRILLARGNHEFRWNRWLSKRIRPGLSWLLESADILSPLAAGKRFDEAGRLAGRAAYRTVRYRSGADSWWFRIGDALFVHPLDYARIPMATIIRAASHLADWGISFRAVVMGHTHAAGRIEWSDGRLTVALRGRPPGDTLKAARSFLSSPLAERKEVLLLEQGCLCEDMDYQRIGKTCYRPGILGYSVIRQDGAGRTQFEESRIVAF